MKPPHCFVQLHMDINHQKHVVKKKFAIHYSKSGYAIKKFVDPLIEEYNNKYAATMGQVRFDQVYIYIRFILFIVMSCDFT